jgi:hypothetical protein
VTGEEGRHLAKLMSDAGRAWWKSIVQDPDSFTKPVFYLGLSGWSVTNFLPDGAHDRTPGRVTLLANGAHGFSSVGDRLCFATQVGVHSMHLPTLPCNVLQERQHLMLLHHMHVYNACQMIHSPVRARQRRHYSSLARHRSMPDSCMVRMLLQVEMAGQYEVVIIYTAKSQATFKLSVGTFHGIKAGTAPSLTAQLPALVSRLCSFLHTLDHSTALL